MAQTIEEYLVALKFNVDSSTQKKFTDSLKSVADTVAKTVGNKESGDGILGNLLKFQFALQASFFTTSAAVVKLGTTFADFDQKMRLDSTFAFMSKNAYTELNRALAITGLTLEQMIWDSEGHQRGLEIMKDTHTLMMQMGPEAAIAAKGIRDLEQQWGRLQNEIFFSGQSVIVDLFKQLGIGDGTLTKELSGFNDYIIAHIPEWSNLIATDLVPVLKESWIALKDLGEVAKDGFIVFQKLVGLLSGDSSLQTTTTSFKQMSDTVLHLVHGLDEVLRAMIAVETFAADALAGHPSLALGALALGGGAAAGVPLAGAAGAGIGLGISSELLGHRDAIDGWMLNNFGFSGDVAHDEPAQQRLSRNATVISKLTGIDANLIFMQLAHETGFGTNRGFKDLHNLAGIEDGKGSYRMFASDEEFDQTLAKILLRDGLNSSVRNPVDYSAILKRGHYFEDSASNYARGMQSFDGKYVAPTLTFNAPLVTVAGTNASPQDISRAVQDGIKRATDRATTSALATSTGAHQ